MLKVKPFIFALLLISYFGVSYGGAPCSSFSDQLEKKSTIIEIYNYTGERVTKIATGEQLVFDNNWSSDSGAPSIENGNYACLLKPSSDNAPYSGTIQLGTKDGATATITFSRGASDGGSKPGGTCRGSGTMGDIGGVRANCIPSISRSSQLLCQCRLIPGKPEPPVDAGPAS